MYLELFKKNHGIDCFRNSKGMDVVVLRNAGVSSPLILERSGGSLVIHTTPDVMAARTETMYLLHEVLPYISDIDYEPFFDTKEISFYDDVDKKVSLPLKTIMSDNHTLILKNKIKPLFPKKSLVDQYFLDQEGYDLTMYVFTDIVVDNTMNMPVGITVDKKDYQDSQSQSLLDVVRNNTAGTVMTAQTKEIIANVKAGIESNILLIGGPGSGKSMAAQQLSAELGIPLVSVNGHSDVSADLLIGGYRPVTVSDSDDIKKAGAPLVRYDGSFVEAYSKGYIYSFEEPNYTPPAVLGRLNNALDFIGELVLEDGTRIKRHPNFIFIASVNAHLVGTHPMNPALIDRMHATYYFNDPTAEDYAAWAKSRLDYSNDVFVTELHAFLTKEFKSLLITNGSNLYPSFRGVEILLTKLSNKTPFNNAMIETFINPLYLDLSEDQVRSVISSCKPLFSDLKSFYKVDASKPAYADLTLKTDVLADQSFDDLVDLGLDQLGVK